MVNKFSFKFIVLCVTFLFSLVSIERWFSIQANKLINESLREQLISIHTISLNKEIYLRKLMVLEEGNKSYSTMFEKTNIQAITDFFRKQFPEANFSHLSDISGEFYNQSNYRLEMTLDRVKLQEIFSIFLSELEIRESFTLIRISKLTAEIDELVTVRIDIGIVYDYKNFN